MYPALVTTIMKVRHLVLKHKRNLPICSFLEFNNNDLKMKIWVNQWVQGIMIPNSKKA